MIYFLRRLPLSRLLLVCALTVVLGICVTALAFALGSGPTPPPKPLADAIHDALAGRGSETVEGVSASIQLTDHLLEGANLANGGEGGGGGGGLMSSPLVAGGSGRLWIAKDGRVRMELQSQQGDTQILYDGNTVSLYDAATNTLYRYTLPAHEGSSGDEAGSSGSGGHQEVPSVAKIEEAISHLSEHQVNVSGATPTDVAGQPAYTVRVSPKQSGSLLGGAELSWDANNGIPLRAAIYSSSSSSPVIELAATEISYGPVESSVFELHPPAGVKVEEGSVSAKQSRGGTATQDCAKQALDCPQPPNSSAGTAPAPKCAAQALVCHEPPRAETNTSETGEQPKLTTHGTGPATIAVLEGKATKGEGKTAEQLEQLPKVKINGTSASELRTELGTLLTFERAGVRYVVAGAVSPAAVEEVARGL